jgi:hypothetical protein
MPDSPLNVSYHPACIGLIPATIEVLGHDPELDDKIAGQVLVQLTAWSLRRGKPMRCS